jgi:hypothetical protein
MPRPEPSKVRLINESALGVYRASWASSSGARYEVAWAEGLVGPMASRLTGALGRSRALTIASPERFGWRVPRKAADFMAFARRFADAVEADDDV